MKYKVGQMVTVKKYFNMSEKTKKELQNINHVGTIIEESTISGFYRISNVSNFINEKIITEITEINIPKPINSRFEILDIR